MDVIILSAWQGVRLRPITYTTPKWLIPINGVCVIDNLIKKISELEVNSVTLLTNKIFLKPYQNWKKNYTWSLKINIVLQKDSPKHKKWTLRSIWYIIKKMKLKQDIFVCAVDNFFDCSLKPAYKFFKQKNQPLIVSYNTCDWEIATHHSVIKYHPDTKRITYIFPKTSTPGDTLCMTFLLFFTQKVWSYISAYLDQKRNADKVGYFFKWLKTKMPLYTYEIKNKKRFDIGNYYSLYKAKIAFGEKKVTLDKLQKGIIG